VDPLVNQTGEPFSYAGDDPVNLSDPSGLEQYKKLTNQQVREVMDALGEDVHDIKKVLPPGTDLYQDSKGNVVILGKNGKGPGDEVGYNLRNQFVSAPSCNSPTGSNPGVSSSQGVLGSSSGFPGVQVPSSAPGFAIASALGGIGGFIAANPEVLLVLGG
jgi:hypothetical protein